jgi:HK97 gp10 family phage protein
MARLSRAAVVTPARAGGFVGVQVLGLPAAIAKLRLIGGATSRRLGYILYATAQRVESVAKEKVPVESGNLESGISTTKLGIYDWVVVAASTAGNIEGKNTKEYAAFVEYGTSKMAAEPFMRPAAAKGREYLVSNVRLLATALERL